MMNIRRITIEIDMDLLADRRVAIGNDGLLGRRLIESLTAPPEDTKDTCGDIALDVYGMRVTGVLDETRVTARLRNGAWAISPQRAVDIYSILEREAGAHLSEDSREAFVNTVSMRARHPATEYRFGGRLGSGGKFRNNGNRPTPYVDCYAEHETPVTLAAIATCNAAIAVLFLENAAEPPSRRGRQNSSWNQGPGTGQ